MHDRAEARMEFRLFLTIGTPSKPLLSGKLPRIHDLLNLISSKSIGLTARELKPRHD